MMKMTVLASGSRGNSTLVSTGRTCILVDAGLSCRELLNRMRAAGEDPGALSAILVSHEHLDHINGLAVLARKLRIPVYFTEPTHRAWARMMTPRSSMTYAQWIESRRVENEASQLSSQEAAMPDLTEASLELPAEDTTLCDNPPAADTRDSKDLGDLKQNIDMKADEPERRPPTHLPAVEYFRAGSPFCIGDIAITPFTIPHDAADPVGFVFEAGGIRMAIATDLGYMPPNVRMALRRCDVLMIESNHDLEMLRDGPYPWSVKQRVLSRVGHLSNNATAEFLSGEYDGTASYVVLAHLSERNNLPELAKVSAELALVGRMNLLANRIVLARQDAPLDPICI